MPDNKIKNAKQIGKVADLYQEAQSRDPAPIKKMKIIKFKMFEIFQI